MRALLTILLLGIAGAAGWYLLREEEPPAPDGAPAMLPPPLVRGRVVDGAGEPVAGAHVIAWPVDEASVLRPAEPEERAVTGEGGDFSLLLRGETCAWSLLAEKPGRTAALLPFVERDATVVVTLREAEPLHGVVMDLAGRPVPGARVRWVGVLSGVALERATTAAADGAYELAGVPTPATSPELFEHGLSWLLAGADGKAPLMMQMDYRSALQNVVLDEGGTLEVHVRDAASGEPVAGARVLAWTEEDDKHYVPRRGVLKNPFAFQPVGESRTGPDGVARVPHVPASGFHDRSSPRVRTGLRAGVVADGFVAAAERVAAVKPGGTVRVDLALAPAVALTGRVVDEGGAPVAGAAISFHVMEKIRKIAPIFDGVPSRKTKSGADGRFRLDQAPATSGVSLDAEAGGAVGACLLDLTGLSEKDAGDVVVKPVRERAATVVVRDAAGRPVRGAEVMRQPPDAAYSPFTDAEGRARLTWTTAVEIAHAIVRAPGCAPVATRRFLPSVERPPEVGVVVRPGATFTGRVVWAGLRPAPGCVVTLFNGAWPLDEVLRQVTMYGGRREGAPAVLRYGTTRTGADGSFEVRDVPPGPYHLVVRHQDRVGGVTETQMSARESGVLVTLGVRPPPEGAATLEGTVRSGDAPVPIFRVALFVDGREVPGVAASAPGRFRGERLPPGRYRLQVTAEGFGTHEREIEVGADDLTVDVDLGKG